MIVNSHLISPTSMATAALRWLFTSSLSRSGILFLSMSALTKVPAFVFLLHHIPLFALICAYIAGRFVYYAIVIHTRHSDTPQVASSFIFAIYHGYYLVHRPCPVICLLQTRKLTIRLCIWLGDVFVFFCFLPSSLPVFLCLFGLMYVFAFHIISFVALRVRIGSFGNSVLPFIIIIIAFEGVNHIGEHIRDWFTGATLLIHHVVYYHSIGTWDFSFSGGSHSWSVNSIKHSCTLAYYFCLCQYSTCVECIICLCFCLTRPLLNTFSTRSLRLSWCEFIYHCMTSLYMGS